MNVSPYSVLRTRFTIPISTSATGQWRVLLLSEHTNTVNTAFPDCITQYVGISGVGTDGPSVTEVRHDDPQISSLISSTGDGSYGRLHAMTMSVQCGAGALSAEGFFYAGIMPGNISRGQYATWNALAQALITRRSMRQYTAYSSLSHASVLATAPQDSVQWGANSAFVGGGGDPTATTRGTDTLYPLAIVWAPTSTSLTYNVTVNCEWRIVYPMGDTRSGLHELHACAAQSTVAKAAAVISAVGGIIGVEGTPGHTLGAMPEDNIQASGIERNVPKLRGVSAPYQEMYLPSGPGRRRR